MDDDRYERLMADHGERLTAEELSQGWHFCPCWDELLIGPGMKEVECCDCDVPDPRNKVEED